jgi:hypothetical protein
MKKLAIFFCIGVICTSSAYCLDLSETEYYALMMDGKKIGYVESSRVVEGGVVTTSEKTKMSISRMGVSIKIGTADISRETVGGKPISFESVMKTSGMSSKTVGKFLKNQKVEISANVFGSIQNKTIDCPEDALMVEGLRLLQVKKGIAAGTSYSAKIFVPQFQASVEAQVNVGPKTQTDLFGRVVSLAEIKVEMEMPAMQGQPGSKVSSTSYVDEDFRALKTITPAMGMTLVMMACDREFAMSPDEEVDFLDKLLLDSPRELKLDGKIVSGKLTYTIKPAPGAKISIPSGDNQTVERKKDGTFVVIVDPAKAKKDVKFPYKGTDREILKMLKPTMHLQSDDKQIIELATHATKGITGAAAAAKRSSSLSASILPKRIYQSVMRPPRKLPPANRATAPSTPSSPPQCVAQSESRQESQSGLFT